ncbi:MAG: Rpn family recombination-promoting nuclease/putative transposase [Oscillospiraceae bacterium]|jgi:predicted transposase/invertase (TIGR01784 family)|nr:Rpn family recombination-promoting nuclease/putative transposase [Oscillospiraceae bacterium]
MSLVILPVKYDVIFKIYFADERNIEFLTDFLKAALPIPAEEYDKITIVDPHLIRDFSDDKLGIVDVKLKTKSGKTIHIDIQVAPLPYMKSRIAYYDAKMISEQLGKSEDYENIKQVISIIITEDEFIPNSPNCHHRFTMYDNKNEVELTDIVEVHTLELCKVPAEQEDNHLYNWLRFIKAEEVEELEAVAQRDPILRKAVATLMELSDDERARMLLEKREMERMDDSVQRNWALKQQAVEIAKAMIADKEPVKKIIKYTGLTKNEIENLKNAN